MEIIVFETQAYYKMLDELKKTFVDALNEVKKKEPKSTLQKKEEEWVGAAEAQEILKCKKDKLRKMRESWEIKSTPKGKHYLYLRSSLYKYLNQYASE